jgi:hypothetical protein
MLQAKECIDTERSFAIDRANAFLAELREEDIISVSYGSIAKSETNGEQIQRSAMLIVYRKHG